MRSPARVSVTVSHGGRHGRIAFAREGRPGVDVAELARRRTLDLLVQGVRAPVERDEVASMAGRAGPRLVLGPWTMKEAVVQVRGRGLLPTGSGQAER